MRIFADQLLPELWYKVIDHVTVMEDTCSLAMINKYFNKLINKDFKQLCYGGVSPKRRDLDLCFFKIRGSFILFNDWLYAVLR
ncbi:unnamed protein product [Bursaphelenchus okinawaensis]|uniref:F-box domain-containing protein n=1 Tax=Bursaphelenchus okinawaensis TaxID=465554 RepID=A0A811KFK2_9BILA|nr:unnamed protein product [Bursaphelenchus okinawaensis]CAD5215148.1 unnamed protein product [Bursaphelenchus okinawaensis]CAG9103582.1 unnamed protein product [Bursaphelenchus okinawaensis]CAG9103630.1 unnamed protein product [Bursaphelenchus okinawaensis]